MNRDLSDFHEVTEELIKDAAELIGGNNAFVKLLDSAEEFRRANATPIFLVNDEQTVGFVTCEETYNRRLH